MFCEQCGNKANDGAAFCQGCGASLSNNNPVADTKIDTDASLPESGISPAYTNNFNSPKKKSPNKTILVLCVVGFIGIAVTLLFILGGERGGRTGYMTCGANNCSNLTVGSYSRCSTHLFTCKVCKKEIGSLSYGYCNEHYPR